MTTLSQENDIKVYSLMLVNPRQARVWMEISASGAHLPTIETSCYGRPADQITAAVFARWEVESILIDWVSEKGGSPDIAILELRSQTLARLSDLSPISIDELDGFDVSATLTASVRRMLAGNTEGYGPFSRFGWIYDVEAWIRCNVPHRPLEFTTTRQLNAGGAFALIKMRTQGESAFWVKAVGPPNTSEFVTTAFLAKHSSSFIPAIVDMRPEWNAWIMEDFGRSLHYSEDLREFENATVRLADLQKHFIGKSDELLSAECLDHSMSALSLRIDEIIDYLDEAMHEQITRVVQPLSTHRMKEIGVLLHEICDRMQELAIPDSLMHGDISPGSILGNGNHCIFTDWCEAYVGNPFITFQQFCVHVGNKTSQSEMWKQRLRSVYKCSWRGILGESQIDTGFQLAPLLALLSYLYGRGDWLNSSRRHEPAFLAYSRSLARHMDRIASDLILRRLPCSSD
jgi:hypothetical protein